MNNKLANISTPFYNFYKFQITSLTISISSCIQKWNKLFLVIMGLNHPYWFASSISLFFHRSFRIFSSQCLFMHLVHMIHQVVFGFECHTTQSTQRRTEISNVMHVHQMISVKLFSFCSITTLFTRKHTALTFVMNLP